MAIKQEKEISTEEYRDLFLKLRSKIDNKIRKLGSIEAEKILQNEYEELCSLAVGGDEVAADFIAYWFKHGNSAVPENIENSMKWLMIAGAGGNKHSISKLNILFNYAYDSIAASENFKSIITIFDLHKGNYQFVLGEMLCKKIIEEMSINSLELAKQQLVYQKYDPIIMQRFSLLVNKAVPKVIEYLNSIVQKYSK